MAAIGGINPFVADLANLGIKTCQHREEPGHLQEIGLTHHNAELGFYGATLLKTWKQPTETHVISLRTELEREEEAGIVTSL